MDVDVVKLSEPTVARIPELSATQLRKLGKTLSYRDERVAFELSRTRDSIRRMEHARGRILEEHTGDDAASQAEAAGRVERLSQLLEQLGRKRSELENQVKKSLLFEDNDGFWTYSGLASEVCRELGCSLEMGYSIKPPHATFPPEFSEWAEEPPADRPYQEEALHALLGASQRGPAAIELPTGSGKSTVLRNAVRTLGNSAVVMAPSVSIATQLRDDFSRYFGADVVGLFGNGKKQYDRQVVVGIDDSLTRIEPGSPAWEALSRKRLFAVDESHLVPAESLQKVCFGLMRDAPYRFFVSATQTRVDGLVPLLRGITGPVIYRKDLRELVDEGWLARPVFKMVQVRSDSSYRSSDQNRMTRAHLYYNPVVSSVAGDLARKFVSQMRRPTLILVEELEQFRDLLPHLGGLRVSFAHGPLTAATKKLVPEEYWKLRPRDAVDSFNAGELDVLVGTSCISTGTDVRVAEAAIYLMGGKSEIKVRQAVGRDTRGGRLGRVMNPWTGEQKLDCIHVDFDVVNPLSPEDEDFTTHRHALARAAIYADLYAPPKSVNYTHLGVAKSTTQRGSR